MGKRREVLKAVVTFLPNPSLKCKPLGTIFAISDEFFPVQSEPQRHKELDLHS